MNKESFLSVRPIWYFYFFSPSSQVLSTRKPFFNQYHYNKISIGPRDVENVKLDETSLMVMIDTKYRQLDNVLLKFQTMVSILIIK